MYRKYYKIWSDEEIELLIKYYPKKCITWPFLFTIFPDRRKASIQNKAYELKMHRGQRKRSSKHFTMIGGREEEYGWSIIQFINDCGAPIGLGYITIVDTDEKNRTRRTQELMTTSEDGNPIHIKNLKKQDYSSRCELCGRTKIRLAYHHWNKKKPSMGIWVCQKCHWLIESYDNKSEEEILEFIRKYKKN